MTLIVFIRSHRSPCVGPFTPLPACRLLALLAMYPQCALSLLSKPIKRKSKHYQNLSRQWRRDLLCLGRSECSERSERTEFTQQKVIG